MTANVLSGGSGAINYISGTLQSFGNNGTTPSGGNVNSGSNTALAYMTSGNGYNPTGAQVLAATHYRQHDHLPQCRRLPRSRSRRRPQRSGVWAAS